MNGYDYYGVCATESELDSLEADFDRRMEAINAAALEAEVHIGCERDSEAEETTPAIPGDGVATAEEVLNG